MKLVRGLLQRLRVRQNRSPNRRRRRSDRRDSEHYEEASLRARRRLAPREAARRERVGDREHFDVAFPRHGALVLLADVNSLDVRCLHAVHAADGFGESGDACGVGHGLDNSAFHVLEHSGHVANPLRACACSSQRLLMAEVRPGSARSPS